MVSAGVARTGVDAGMGAGGGARRCAGTGARRRAQVWMRERVRAGHAAGVVCGCGCGRAGVDAGIKMRIHRINNTFLRRIIIQYYPHPKRCISRPLDAE